MQGNLDPCGLYAPSTDIEARVKMMVQQFGRDRKLVLSDFNFKNIFHNVGEERFKECPVSLWAILNKQADFTTFLNIPTLKKNLSSSRSTFYVQVSWYGRWVRVKLSISVTPNVNQTKLLI